MGKYTKRTLEEKIVKEYKAGSALRYLCQKYGISNMGTIKIWNIKYDEGTLSVDNRGKKKSLEGI